MKEYKMITTFSVSICNIIQAENLEEAEEKAETKAWAELADDLDLQRLSIGDFAAQTEEMK